jgi:hypothetical protein
VKSLDAFSAASSLFMVAVTVLFAIAIGLRLGQRVTAAGSELFLFAGRRVDPTAMFFDADPTILKPWLP